MELPHRGKHSMIFPQMPSISAWASVAGKKEAQGPLGHCFDITSEDTKFGQKTWEQAEIRMQTLVLQTLLQKTKLQESDLDAAFVGDLLNQCVGSSFTLRNRGIPTLGLYGACSTMAESLLLGAMAVSGGFCRRALAMTSSHFATAERQYRFPLGYGGQRTPTAQWTVTGAGGVILSKEGPGPYITGATIGTVVDLGITDANNMGAAMAPAAYETIRTHLEDLGMAPEDYDLIVTGDLGTLGHRIVRDLADRDGLMLGNHYQDCGCMIFDIKTQDVHCGGSGCGCSASVLCGHLLDQMRKRKLSRLLFCGTGALLSPLTVQQRQSVPAVCHAVSISMERS